MKKAKHILIAVSLLMAALATFAQRKKPRKDSTTYEWVLAPNKKDTLAYKPVNGAIKVTNDSSMMALFFQVAAKANQADELRMLLDDIMSCFNAKGELIDHKRYAKVLAKYHNPNQ